MSIVVTMFQSSRQSDWYNHHDEASSPTDNLNSAYIQSLDLEIHLNDGGCSTIHPFKDLRSAACARNRERSIRNRHSGCRSFQCRKSRQYEARRSHKASKRALLRSAINDGQTTVHGHILPWMLGKPDFIVWDTNANTEFDSTSRLVGNGAVERYVEFGENAAVFESNHPPAFDGETFVAWAQRRISEMRAVKERRIMDPKSRPDLVGRTLYHYVPTKLLFPFHSSNDRRQNIAVYVGTPLTTTLPTNSYDAYGHALLRKTLRPYRHWLCRVTNTNPHRAITDPGWFGEYSWAWHRNRSGCWELGYFSVDGNAWQRCSDNERHMLYSGPIMAPTFWGPYYDCPCWCREFEDGEGNMRGAPEDGESCCLLEWVDWEGRRLVLKDQERNEESRRAGRAEDGIEGVQVEEDWIVLSRRSSATWSLVGDDV